MIQLCYLMLAPLPPSSNRLENDVSLVTITALLSFFLTHIYCSPYAYESRASGTPDEYPAEDGSGRIMRLVRHVSFVDCPGECAHK